MTLKSQMATDFSNVFLNSDEFAESVDWTPNGGSESTVTALVERDQAEPDNTDEGLEVHRWATVRFATSDVSGIARGDKLSFAVESGGSDVDWTIASEPVNHGDGAVAVRCYRREPIEKASGGHRRAT